MPQPDPSPFDTSGAQFAWDSTSLKLVETCLYKYKLKMLDGYQPDRKSVHLLFGGWYASALENFHKAIADGVAYEEAVIDIVHETLLSTWSHELDEEGSPIEGTGTPWTSDHNAKTRENLIRTIIWYLDQFKDDPCETVRLTDGSAAVEYTFKLPVDNDIIFSGHLDRLVDYGKHLYVQDQKTTASTITPRYFEGYSPDTQMSMYTFAGKAIFNLPVKGVMIDAAQIAVGFTRFERGFTFRDDSQLTEWYDLAMHNVERARKATLENYFPQNPSSCGNFGGCEFRHICSKSPVVRSQFLAADFTKGEIWNPLRSR